MINNQSRFTVLDSFRGLCAIFVVLYHLKILGGFSELSFFRGSSLFVEFFFVLSGFVLTHGYGSKLNLSFSQFITVRIFRLFPLHIVILVVFILLESAKWLFTSYYNLQLNNDAFTEDYSPVHIIPNLLLIHAWSPSTNPLSFNTPSWSISIEFYTYILLFITLMLTTRKRFYIWLFISVLSFSFIIFELGYLTSQALRGLSCFFAGSCCYLIFSSKSFKKITLSKKQASLIEVCLLTLVYLIVSSNIQHKSIISSFLFMIVVLFFAREEGLTSSFLQKKIFVWLGNLSYSIYMVHGVVIYLYTSLFLVCSKMFGLDLLITQYNDRYFNLGNLALNNLLILIIFINVLFFSWLTYHFIELPGQHLGKKVRKKIIKPELFKRQITGYE